MWLLLKRLLQHQGGTIAIMGALLLAPVITMLTISVEVTRYLTKQTRLVQAQASAAYAIAKEGRPATTAQHDSLMNAYILTNLSAVRDSGDKITNKCTMVTQDSNRIISRFEPKSIFDRILDVTLPVALTESQVVAERAFKPLELVIVIDGSSSVSAILPELKEGAARIIDDVMGVSDNNTYISLIAYSGYVNIGWEYKDVLITPESRRPWTASQRALTAQYGFDDLLDPQGPEGKREGACVLRPMLLPSKGTTQGLIKKYVDLIETPPTNPEEGFTLLMNDRRPVPLEESNSATDQTTYFLQFGFGAPKATTVDRDSPFYLDNGDVRDVATIGFAQDKKTPYAWADEARNPSKFHYWGKTHNARKKLGLPGGSPNWGELVAEDKVIHVPWNCSTMPMLIASQDKDEILDRLDTLRSGWMTGTDEGIAWAMRALSPNWRRIWNRGEYPADYNDGVTTKRIMLLGGSMTQGYFTESRNAVSEMCKRLKENGVEIYILVDKSESPNAQSEKIYKECAEENYTLAPSSSALPEYMEMLGRRAQIARLTN